MSDIGNGAYTSVHLLADVLLPIITFLATYTVMVMRLKTKIMGIIDNMKGEFVCDEMLAECKENARKCRTTREEHEKNVDRGLLSIRAQLATNSLVLTRIGKALNIPDEELQVIEKTVNRILNDK